MRDHDSFYDKNMRWHSISPHIGMMARHLHDHHDMTVRAINRATGLTDLEVRHCLGDRLK